MKFLWLLTLLVGCVHGQGKSDIAVDKDTAQPGTKVHAGDAEVKLYKTAKSIQVGKPITPFVAELGDPVNLVGNVAVIDVVPSIDTKVCEQQTHILGEAKTLAKEVKRISISRDLPMAQQRFAKEAKLENIQYLSDYKKGGFGKSSGLMMQGNELLARAVIVVDRKGIVRYLQVVPNVAHLPDMDKAFEVANSLVAEK